jgi:hypothetical protein
MQSSQRSAKFYQATLRHIPDDSNLHIIVLFSKSHSSLQIYGYVRVLSQVTLSRMFINYDGTLSQITCSISVYTLNYSCAVPRITYLPVHL